MRCEEEPCKCPASASITPCQVQQLKVACTACLLLPARFLLTSCHPRHTMHVIRHKEDSFCRLQVDNTLFPAEPMLRRRVCAQHYMVFFIVAHRNVQCS
jgi:hypothetical protein